MRKTNKKKKAEETFRADQVKLTQEEMLKRAKDLPKRMEKIIAAVRKSKN